MKYWLVGLLSFNAFAATTNTGDFTEIVINPPKYPTTYNEIVVAIDKEGQLQQAMSTIPIEEGNIHSTSIGNGAYEIQLPPEALIPNANTLLACQATTPAYAGGDFFFANCYVFENKIRVVTNDALTQKRAYSSFSLTVRWTED